MRLIIIRRKESAETTEKRDLLRFAVSTEPIAGMVINGLNDCLFQYRGVFGTYHQPFSGHLKGEEVVYVLPQDWQIEPCRSGSKIITYREAQPIHLQSIPGNNNGWFVISDGRFVAKPNYKLLRDILANATSEVVAVNVKPELLAYRERVRLTARGRIVGFRRLYSDSFEIMPVPYDWPHYVFVRHGALEKILHQFSLPYEFSDFLQHCLSAKTTITAFDVAGTVSDLSTEYGLLNFCTTRIQAISLHRAFTDVVHYRRQGGVSKDANIIGTVLLGDDVYLGPGTVIVGPAIIADHAIIEQQCLVRSSIIGSNVTLTEGQVVQNSIVIDTWQEKKELPERKSENSKQYYTGLDMITPGYSDSTFRTWPLFSYPQVFKRIIDIFTAIIILILFAPIIPFIALAIKLGSPGPIFFKHRRQGRHGKEFYCLKFRTMNVGADQIQEKLRSFSEVDGPQFKLAEDPRLNAVGEFLRETYIDEIPQFLNVLLGQMSVVGPRPSPESENTLCPTWRDARLSIRPGITGLWQVCRTREPMRDFQEWIYYDTKYVQEMSFSMDLWISWQTLRKMMSKFISQF